jgi:hypothetical protein
MEYQYSFGWPFRCGAQRRDIVAPAAYFIDNADMRRAAFSIASQKSYKCIAYCNNSVKEV